MVMFENDVKLQVESLIQEKLKPYVRKIDAEAFYAEDYLRSLGKAGLLKSVGFTEQEVLSRGIGLVEETSKTCMTTGFNLWCHFASLTYLRKSNNEFLKSEILPLLENGELLGGTGLSNPMKYYSGLEPLHLQFKQADGGYVISGFLPSVSNLGHDHWFGIVAKDDQGQEIMAYVRCDVEGLTLKEKAEYLGVNGSATYSCKFDEVFIPSDWILSDDASKFVEVIRPAFVLYQIPLGLGVTEASIESIKKVPNKQEGCNRFLNIQADELEDELAALREKTYRVAQQSDVVDRWKKVLQVRLDVVELTLKAAHACMLHQGGAAYLKISDPARRLRETYFLVNLSPTVKHLEKLLCK